MERAKYSFKAEMRIMELIVRVRDSSTLSDAEKGEIIALMTSDTQVWLQDYGRGKLTENQIPS